MPNFVWRVVVRREIDRAAQESLGRVGASYVSGHSGHGFTSSSLLIRAKDESSARALIMEALGAEVPITEATSMPVFVHAPIEPAAKAAFEEAARDDPRVAEVVQDESTGALDVRFELPGGGVNRPLNEARGIYDRVIDQAGLAVPEQLEMSMSGFEALLSHASRDLQLLDRADELLGREEYELAVIVAQTACEVLIADALRDLLEPHGSDELIAWALPRIRNFSLIDDPTRELWKVASGSAIQDEAFWEAYRTHVKRRNAIVHRGDRVDEASARASLDASKALFSYVERMIGAGGPMSPT